MRVLGAVVQIPALSVFDAGKQMALRGAVASRLVGHDHPRHILQSLQQSSEETLGSVGITPILNQNVEHDSVLIHRAPEIVLLRDYREMPVTLRCRGLARNRSRPAWNDDGGCWMPLDYGVVSSFAIIRAVCRQ